MGENRRNKQAEVSICWFGVNECAEYGKRELLSALQTKGVSGKELAHWILPHEGVTVVAGTTEDRRIQVLLEAAGVEYHLPAESILVHWCTTQNGQVLVISGTDSVGLMYALLEMARKINCYGMTALTEQKSDLETPENKVRCMDRYLLGHLDNEWFLDGSFWEYYLKRLAKARFNRFCLIVGFDTAYMAPPYPFFLSVPGFEQVSVPQLSEKDVAANLQTLHTIGTMCHEYGLQFVFATWQQRPWTEGQKRLVEGLPEEETALSEYCHAGLKALIGAVPEIDIVQFRVNHESGVGDQVSAEDFWNHCADAVAEVAKEQNRPLILDLRAKGLTDSMIAHAFAQGLQIEVPTKFWCEHAALPYHLSVMRTEELSQLENLNHSRRYSYADMLKKPKYYDVLYRLWNYGSTNLFLWGDADYAKRFAKSCQLSGSIGYEVNSPLSLKYGHELSHVEAWDTFKDPSLKSKTWEDERFWMWYLVFGRLGYCTETDPEVWMSEFNHRFENGAGVVLEKALAAASKIVPLVTTIHMPVHPSLRYWTELNTGWALFAENNLNEIQAYDFEKEITYGSTEPSDHGLFYGIDEFARDAFAGELCDKFTPIQTASWLLALAKETEDTWAKAKQLLPDCQDAEFLAMGVDFSMLCDFARYHAFKMYAALALAHWKQTGQKEWLSDSAQYLNQSISYWEQLAEKGLKYYHDDLNFGSAGSETRKGTWADLTVELKRDEQTLQALLREHQVEVGSEVHKALTSEVRTQLTAEIPEVAMGRKPLKIKAFVSGVGMMPQQVTLHYRKVNQVEGAFHTISMKHWSGGEYTAEIPAEYITTEWDLMVYVTTREKDGSCLMFPGVYHPTFPYPYQVVETVES